MSQQVVHYGVSCDCCRISPLVGIRYKCSSCPNYDLCGDCIQLYENGRLMAHPMDHIFYRLHRHRPDLRCFMSHHNIVSDKVCYGCGIRPIVGYRYECPQCLTSRCAFCEQRFPCGHNVLKVIASGANANGALNRSGGGAMNGDMSSSLAMNGSAVDPPGLLSESYSPLAARLSQSSLAMGSSPVAVRSRSASPHRSPYHPSSGAFALPASPGNGLDGRAVLIRAVNHFADAFWQAGGRDDTFISPLSITFSLLLAANASRGLGREQVMAVLGLSNDLIPFNRASRLLITDVRQTKRLHIINGVWASKSGGVRFSDAFTTLCADTFLAASRVVRSAVEVNAWVASQTDNQVLGILSELSTLCLSGVFFYKVDWTLRFPRTATQSRMFQHPAHARGLPVQMMALTAPFRYVNCARYEGVRLPCRGGLEVLLVRSQWPDLPTFLDLWSALQGSAMVGTVELPRFAMDSCLEISPVLKAMGVQEVLEESDLQPLLREPQPTGYPLGFNQVLQRARLEVDEQGGSNDQIHVNPREVSFHMVFDAPFHFFLVHAATSCCLFRGKVSQPEPI
eukprot:gene5093-5597_t